jgi:hypothetical protein
MATATVTSQLIPATLEIDPAKGFKMNVIADALTQGMQSTTTATITGVFIPVVCMGGCKQDGVIVPESDNKEVASQVYNYGMQITYRPIWDGLYSLYQILKGLGLGVLDLSLGVLELHVDDLFNPDLLCIIQKAIKDLYEHLKNEYARFVDQIKHIFNQLGIPWPLFKGLQSIEETLKYIAKHIWASLWNAFHKILKKLIDLINDGLALWDAIHSTNLAEAWKKLINSILKTIYDTLSKIPTLEDIKKAIEDFAKHIYNQLSVTVDEIMKIIHKFKLPIFGSPFDWKFPLNPHVNFPDLDFNKVLNDIMLWINNFIQKIILAFWNAIEAILKLFNISGSIPKIKIPYYVCATVITRNP